MVILIVSIGVAIMVSFLCSLLEACLLSISNSDIARMNERHAISAGIWKSFKSNIQKPLSVILIINTLAIAIGASVSGAQFNKLFGDRWITVYSLAFSIVMILWSEILPKTLGVRYNSQIAGIIAVPFSLVVRIFRPVVAAIELVNRPFIGKKRDQSDSAISDIGVLARSAFLENLISKEQESIIARSMHMSKLVAQDVMISRSDINVLNTAMNLQEGLIAAHLHRHTRFPLAQNGDIDRIIGYVNFKDIVGALQVNPSDPSLRGVMRPVIFVKSATGIPELLAKLTRGYQHIAIVQDDKGSTIGLVTMEDVIETLVGRLQDEYDTPPEFIIQLAEHRFRVGGNARFSQIKARAFPELTRNDDQTLDAWFKAAMKGKLPAENFQRNLESLTVKVRRIVRGNIYDVIIERAPVAGAQETKTAG
jgi:CBS domain containing-hemolysin-like protein